MARPEARRGGAPGAPGRRAGHSSRGGRAAGASAGGACGFSRGRGQHEDRLSAVRVFMSKLVQEQRVGAWNATCLRLPHMDGHTAQVTSASGPPSRGGLL